jgi:hypothetical protein
VALLFVQDWNGITVLYEKGWGEFTLNRRETSLEGTLSIQLIWAGTDPLNPDPAKILVSMQVPLAARPIR